MKLVFLLVFALTPTVFADSKNYFKINSNVDFISGDYLDSPKVYKVDSAFVPPCK